MTATPVHFVKRGTVIVNVVDGHETISVTASGELFYKGKKYATDKELRRLLEEIIVRQDCDCAKEPKL